VNIASALIKQILDAQDFETWSILRKHYLPSEYHTIYSVIDKHCDEYHSLPKFDDLKYAVRDSNTKEKLFAIKSIEVEAEAEMLLQYLKNEYTQKEVLNELENYVENSVAFETAEETLSHLHEIVLRIEDKVELKHPEESMQYISLFEPDEELDRYISLGLNDAYDSFMKFSPRDLILIGGRRGGGKSVTCSNIANSVVESGKSAIYFTIEMDSRSILQRCCSIATGVPLARLRTKNLNVKEWESVAQWWANRFERGNERLKEYKQHRDFNEFHTKLKESELLPTQLDIVYEPSLTIGKIKADLDKKCKKLDVGIVIVDYINQVKRSNLPSRGGQYDWTEQIEVSKALKAMAQEYETPILAPYQTDATGEARFAKGILDAADAAYSMDTHAHEDGCITFTCQKMRSASMESFTSKINWDSLKIGPESALTPEEQEANSEKTGEEIDDI
jgi:replicative DNA helicase|tara:strand:- start:4534 stop:5877 length:1344 start_codon:yes stop_codon:yes gene_type:complete